MGLAIVAPDPDNPGETITLIPIGVSGSTQLLADRDEADDCLAIMLLDGAYSDCYVVERDE